MSTTATTVCAGRYAVHTVHAQSTAMRGRSTLLLLLGGLLCGTAAAREPLTISPEKPTWNQPLQVTYDPAGDGAKLSLDQGLYISAWAVYADGWHQHEAYALRRVDDHCVGEIPVKEPLCYIRVSVGNRYDVFDDHQCRTMIYRPDGQPVRHAYGSQIGDADTNGARELFDKEIALYPDNYYAHRAWWNKIKWSQAADYPSVLTEGLRHIEQSVTGKPLDWQFARITGYLDLKQEERARAILLDMLRESPEARFTYFASRIYRYRTFADNEAGSVPAEVNAAIITAVRKHPASHLARAGLEEYTWDDTFPPDVLTVIAKAWIPDDPWHSLPHYTLAVAAERQGDMQTAYDEVRRAIHLALVAGQHLPEAVEARNEVYNLPPMYGLWAKTALALEKYDEALVAARTASSLAEGDSTGKVEELEGTAWSRLGVTYHADRAFIAAHLRDPRRGMDGLRDLYRRAHGSEDGFDSHYAELMDEALRGKLELAPKYSAVTMNGVKHDSEQLRGKVVVLNFWFIGCAPCRAEIPDLNRLVAAFGDRDDVVFLAPSHDDRRNLEHFLKENTFAYQVVPEALALNELFDVHGHPTHVIIDRLGRILWRQTGNQPFEVLKPTIERALAMKDAPSISK